MSGTKNDLGKTRLDLIPPEALELIGQAFTHGAVKYGDHNWRGGIDSSRLYGAAKRHMNAYWGGEDIDEDSGLPHLALAGAEICMLMASDEMHDDRWKKENPAQPIKINEETILSTMQRLYSHTSRQIRQSYEYSNTRHTNKLGGGQGHCLL